MALSLLWGAQLALADPVALRTPGMEGDHAAVAVSTRSLSAAMAGSPPAGLRLGVDVAWDGGAVELAGGLAGQRVGPARWGVEGGVAVGVAVLTVARSAALTATPWVGVGRFGSRAAGSVRLVAPIAAGPTGVRLPVAGELAATFGPRWLRVGPRAAVGAAWAVGPAGVEASALAEVGMIAAVALD